MPTTGCWHWIACTSIACCWCWCWACATAPQCILKLHCSSLCLAVSAPPPWPNSCCVARSSNEFGRVSSLGTVADRLPSRAGRFGGLTRFLGAGAPKNLLRACTYPGHHRHHGVLAHHVGNLAVLLGQRAALGLACSAAGGLCGCHCADLHHFPDACSLVS